MVVAGWCYIRDSRMSPFFAFVLARISETLYYTSQYEIYPYTIGASHHKERELFVVKYVIGKWAF